VTITDLLAHRSGLPRHDLTWIGHPDRSRADLVRRLRFLPLSRTCASSSSTATSAT
jgi:CubicO group peptidase (beta-lactamase class C family)